MMEKQENVEIAPPIPILQRLDRLDVLVQFIEEKHSLSGRHSWIPLLRNKETENRCKTMSSAIEEAHHKGTLMERVATLENRVLQLCLEIDVENTTGSSSSTVVVPENFGDESVLLMATEKDKVVNCFTIENKQDPCTSQASGCDFSEACAIRKPEGCREGRGRRRGASKSKYYRKWFSWLRLGC